MSHIEIEIILDLAKKHIPYLTERVEILKVHPTDLVGKKLMSIENGFGGRGQVMEVESVGQNEGGYYLNLIPCAETFEANKSHTWGIPYAEVGKYLILYDYNTKLRRKLCFNT